MISKKVKESKNYFKKKSELLQTAISKLLELISEEHNIPIEELNKIHREWLDRKSRSL